MWYYRKGFLEAGPVSESELYELVREGTVTGYTAVRRESGRWTSLSLTPLAEGARAYVPRPAAGEGGPRPNRFGLGLTLLTAALVAAGPLMTVNSIYDMVEILARGHGPGTVVITIMAGLLGAGMSAFGAYAGVKLWTIAANGPRMAMAYLLANMVAAAAALALYFLVRLGMEIDGGFDEVLVWTMIFAVFGFFVWGPYLLLSRRVKQTYGLGSSS